MRISRNKAQIEFGNRRKKRKREMDDFDFPPVLEDLDDPAVGDVSSGAHAMAPMHGGNEEQQEIPSQHLGIVPIGSLPKTNAPRLAAGGTIGSSIRGLVSFSRSRRGPPQLVLPTHRPVATPFVGSAQPADPVPPLEPDGTVVENAAQGDKYRWAPKRKSFAFWSDDETHEFYEAVSQFGTDFTVIAVLFPGRDREAIAHKFKIEQKRFPDRILQALGSSSQKPIDMQKFDECKRKCEQLRAGPVHVLNQEEEDHLLAIANTQAIEDDETASHRVGGKESEAPAIEEQQLKEEGNDFFFDEDVPVASLYSNRAGQAKTNSRKADAATSSKIAKEKKKDAGKRDRSPMSSPKSKESTRRSKKKAIVAAASEPQFPPVEPFSDFGFEPETIATLPAPQHNSLLAHAPATEPTNPSEWHDEEYVFGSLDGPDESNDDDITF